MLVKANICDCEADLNFQAPLGTATTSSLMADSKERFHSNDSRKP